MAPPSYRQLAAQLPPDPDAPKNVPAHRRPKAWLDAYRRTGGDFDAACRAAGIGSEALFGLTQTSAALARVCAEGLTGVKFAMLARAAENDLIAVRVANAVASFCERRILEAIRRAEAAAEETSVSESGAGGPSHPMFAPSADPVLGRAPEPPPAPRPEPKPSAVLPADEFRERIQRWLAILGAAQRIAHRATRHQQGVQLTEDVPPQARGTAVDGALGLMVPKAETAPARRRKA